jgi:hypothetical protein
MSLSPEELSEIRKIVSIAEKILAKAAEPRSGRTKSIASVARTPKAARRKGKELVAFRKMLLAEKKRGVPVIEIARKHGVTANYVYQMK